MDALADTGFVFALFHPRDALHQHARSFYLRTEDRILVPTITLGELTYLTNRAGGTRAVISLMRALRQSDVHLLEPTTADYDRALDILDKYADSRIDFVDACIMALTERLNITRILTFDHRDFGLYRPAHAERFEL